MILAVCFPPGSRKNMTDRGPRPGFTGRSMNFNRDIDSLDIIITPSFLIFVVLHYMPVRLRPMSMKKKETRGNGPQVQGLYD